jgi:8-amino-7-oxononanoate synthase
MIRLRQGSGGQGLSARVAARMDALDRAGLRRTLRARSGIDLTSNDYLGLATHPLVVQRMADAVACDGAGSTGSRLLRGERDSFSAIEARFARFKGTERSLYFSSGYLANIAVLTTLAEDGDVIISDERNHASLIDGIRLSPATREIVPHNDVAAVRTALEKAGKARGAGGGERFVVVESLFSMDGDEAPLEEYAALCAEAGAHLIVDEAHAVGVYGERGSGLIEELGIADRVFLSVNTAGKALGVSGAFVTGPAWAIDYLIQRARPFVFSTAPPPAVAAALDASLEVIDREPGRRALLRERAAALRERLMIAGITVGEGASHIVPVLIGDNDRAVAIADALQADGFDVRAIRPPTVPPGTARLRISVNVNLTDDIIIRFVGALSNALARAGLVVGR